MARGPELPPNFVVGLIALSELDEAKSAELEKRLRSVGVTLKFDDLISGAQDGQNSDALKPVIETVVGLCATAEKYNLKKVLANVKDSIEQSEAFRDFDLPKKELLLERLKNLIGEGSGAKQFLKANRVVQSHHQVFSECQILTDIRPIFNENGDEAIGATIVHSLKIDFRKGENHHSFYVALDDTDLKTLQRQISRANIKSKTLQTILTKSGIKCLSPNDPSDANETA